MTTEDANDPAATQPRRGAEDAEDPVIRSVLDTSVLVPPHLRRELQIAAQAGLYTAYWSPWVIAELNRVLTWRWIRRIPAGTSAPDLSRANERRCSEAAHTMMELLLPTFRLVETLPPYPPAWEALKDRWDHPVWAAAKACGARYVVSENTSDFPPAQADGTRTHEGIEYVTGDAFLRLISGTDLA
jgi:predicted nucleic acid-binding protein